MRSVRVTMKSLRYDTSMAGAERRRAGDRSAADGTGATTAARRRRSKRLGVAMFAACAIFACSGPPKEPIQLDRGILTVDNQSGEAWSAVEIWINDYYRIAVSGIPAGGRFQAPLGSAVSGFGQRFDFGRMQVKDVRLTAKLPDGRPMELKKQFPASGLAGALGGKR